MLNKEEIEKAKQEGREIIGNFKRATTEFTKDIFPQKANAVETLLEYIDQLEKQVKELNKGNHSLMQSRKKWKNRYYNEKEKSKDLQESVDQIYENYQDIGKMYFDLDEKHDKLIEELETDKMEQFDDYIIYLQEKYLHILKSNLPST